MAKKTAAVPKNWPQSIQYLTRPVYSKSIPQADLDQLNAPSPNTPTHQPTIHPSNLIKITPITNPTHPAHGQSGLFATTHLPPDTFILFYQGYIHSQTDTDPTSDYDLSLDRDLGIGIDATKMGSEARFINDYRGVAGAANAEFRECWVEVLDGKGKKGWERWMGVFVLTAGRSGRMSKGIVKGEEILVSYGKGFWMERAKEVGGEVAE